MKGAFKHLYENIYVESVHLFGKLKVTPHFWAVECNLNLTFILISNTPHRCTFNVFLPHH